MGRTIATAMTYERSKKTPVVVTRKAANRLNNDINVMPTHEVFRRLYKRHSVGVWETITAVTWVIVLVSKLN